MKSKTLLAVIAVCAIAGVLAGVGLREWNDDSTPVSSPTNDPTAEPTDTETPAEPPTLDELVVTPGAIGPVQVGMTEAEGLATGLLEPGTSEGPQACPAPPLVWKKPYFGAVDVLTREDGEIASLGIWEKGPATESGIGIGSTFAEVQAIADRPEPEDAGYGQAGLFIFDSELASWIGFLFDAPGEQVEADDEVSFMEVTRGSKPDLIRDGC